MLTDFLYCNDAWRCRNNKGDYIITCCFFFFFLVVVVVVLFLLLFLLLFFCVCVCLFSCCSVLFRYLLHIMHVS